MKKHKKQLNDDRMPPEASSAVQPDEDFARMLAAMFEAELGDGSEERRGSAPAPRSPELSAEPEAPSAPDAASGADSADLFRAVDELLGPSQPAEAEPEPVPAPASLPDRSSASLHTESEPEEAPLGRKALRARRKAEKQARRAAKKAQAEEDDGPLVLSASGRQALDPAPDRRSAPGDTGRLELPSLNAKAPEAFDPLPAATQKPVPGRAASEKDKLFTIQFETFRIPKLSETPAPAAEVPVRVPKEPVVTPGSPAPGDPEAPEDADWSDARLFAEIDRVLSYDPFSGDAPAAPREEVPESSTPAEPDRRDLSARTKRIETAAPLQEAEPAAAPIPSADTGTSAPVTMPSAETLKGPGRGALIDTEPLPSLEELFPAAVEPAPEPIPEPVPEPAEEPLPETAPAPEAPADIASAEPEADAAPESWEALPSPRELFDKPTRDTSAQEATETPEADAEQAKPQAHRRRRFGSWLSDLLHPKFNDLPEEEPDFSVPSDLTEAPLPRTIDALPDQLPLEGFTAPDPGNADSAELPEQLPLLGFAPEATAPEEPAVPVPPAPFAPAPEATAPERPAASPVLPYDFEEEPEGEDGPDLIPQVRNTGSAGGKSRRGSLSLQELLAAAIPMEEAEPPLGSVRQPRPPKPPAQPKEETVSVPREVPDQISTIPENPAGLIRKEASAAQSAKPDTFQSKSPAPPQEAAEARPRKPAKKPAEREEHRKAPAAPPAAPVPAASEAVPHPAPAAPAKAAAPAAQDVPVPSASVRTNRERARAAAQAEAQKTRQEAPPPKPRQTERPRPAPAKREIAILHPEEAYRKYAKSVSTLGSRMVLTGLFTVLSLFLTLYLSLQWKFLPEIFSGGTSTYVLLALLIAMVLTNLSLYADAVKSLKGKKHSPNLLILLATIFTALDTFQAAKDLRPQFTAVVGLLLLISLWGQYDLGMALITTVKVLRDGDVSVGVSDVPDITKGSRGLTRTEPDVEQFMEKLETRDLCERVVSVYTPIAALAGLALTALVAFGLHRDPFWTGSLIMIGTVPLTGLIAFPRLFLLLSQRLSAARTALCGYHGAEAFGGEHAILIGDDDVFPQGSLTLNGFKVYSGNPDRIIAYAAAATRSSGSALAPLFEDLLRTHVGRRYSVDAFRFYDSGGIGATIIGDVVLMGSLDFMRRMGVHMDKGSKVRQAVYLSINGELAAVFAVKYTPPENLRRGLAALANNRHFKGILVTRTFLGTPGFLKAKFGIPIGSFTYPSTKERLRLSEAELKHAGAQGALLAEDSFTGFAQAAAGGRTLRSASVLAAVLSLLAGSVGLLLMSILAALPAYETATAVNLLLFEAAWLAPTLLLSGWTRHF